MPSMNDSTQRTIAGLLLWCNDLTTVPRHDFEKYMKKLLFTIGLWRYKTGRPRFGRSSCTSYSSLRTSANLCLTVKWHCVYLLGDHTHVLKEAEGLSAQPGPALTSTLSRQGEAIWGFAATFALVNDHMITTSRTKKENLEKNSWKNFKKVPGRSCYGTNSVLNNLPFPWMVLKKKNSLLKWSAKNELEATRFFSIQYMLGTRMYF